MSLSYSFNIRTIRKQVTQTPSQEGVSVSRYSENRAKQRFLSHDEQDSLLSASKKANWDEFYLVVLLAITTAARKGEISSLKWAFDIKKSWASALKVSGIGHCRFHDLRHTVASNLVKSVGYTQAVSIKSHIQDSSNYGGSVNPANIFPGIKTN